MRLSILSVDLIMLFLCPQAIVAARNAAISLSCLALYLCGN